MSPSAQLRITAETAGDQRPVMLLLAVGEFYYYTSLFFTMMSAMVAVVMMNVRRKMAISQ